MSFQCGIVGLSNVGKSTLFEGLTGIQHKSANYLFSTIDPNRALVPVPDPRMAQIAAIVQPQNIVPTTIEFVDIAGLVPGASQGEGLGNQFLSHIREVDVLIHVVRCFEDVDIMHVSGQVDSIVDINAINTELILSDLERVEKGLQRHQKLAQSGDKNARSLMDLLLKAKHQLDQILPLRQLDWEQADLIQLKAWQFLTLKPMLYLANIDEQGLHNNPLLEAVLQHAALEGAQAIPSCVKLESEFANTSELEKQDLLSLIGYQETSLEQLIRAGYKLLNLQTFFTAGQKELRAWTVPVGATAFEAAACIHTDFQKGFIRAEVISYEDFLQFKGEQGAKTAGKWRLEGKTYSLQDGDILHFRFNV